MTATLTAPELEAPPSSRVLVLQLGRFETLRALRHPLTWVGVAGSAWTMWSLGGDVAPILQRDSVFLAGAMLPLAASTLLVANYATLRQKRIPELLGSQPTGTEMPVLGVQLGVTGPVLLAVLLQAVGLVYLFLGGPIGPIDWWELAVGPAIVAVFGMGGVLLGRWLRHPIVAPVTLVGLAVLQLLASPDAQIFSSEPTANVEWLAPWMIPSAFSPIEDLAARPLELHLIYLLGLGVLLGSFAFRLEGTRRARRLGLAGSFVVAVVAISLILPPEPRFGFDWPEAAASQTCVTEDGVEYCAFGFYADWIPRWQETVAAVDALIPVRIEKVMQRPHNIGLDEPEVLEAPGLVLTSTHWDRQGATPYHRFELALGAARSAVGLPTTPQTREWTEEEIESILAQNPNYEGDLRAQLELEPLYPRSCSSIGQARAVVAVWMAASALKGGDDALRASLGENPARTTFRIGFDGFHNPATTIGRQDAELALELLDLHTAKVRDTLTSRWPEVTNPGTTSPELASWFRLSNPVYAERDFAEAPCP